MKNLSIPLFLLAFACLGHAASAQVDKNRLHDFNQRRTGLSRTGMAVLGTWAVGNLLAGGVMMGRTDGSRKAFHQMNAGWGLINLGLAGAGYYAAFRADPAALDLYETLKDQYSLEKTFLFNAGLDVGYVLGGLYLTERARNTARNPERLSGFGQSVMLQGGFLFAFDLVMFFLVNHHGQLLKPLLENVTLTGSLQGAGATWRF